MSNISPGDVILAISFFALVWTGYETRRLANETVESNLRPLIFRGGQILDWKVKSLEEMRAASDPETTLVFTNLKNTATDISGYIILDNQKYPLIFHGDVRGAVIKNSSSTAVVYNKVWSWLPSNGSLNATYSTDGSEKVTEPNQICLHYKDIEGNSYVSIENSNYVQTSKKGGACN